MQGEWFGMQGFCDMVSVFGFRDHCTQNVGLKGEGFGVKGLRCSFEGVGCRVSCEGCWVLGEG